MPVKKGTVAEQKPARNMISDAEVMERPRPPRGGSCIGKPTEWWYPLIGENDSVGRRKGWSTELNASTKKALEVCSTCPVKLQCLRYSLEWEPFGIWGGMTERQRQRLRLELRVPARFAEERAKMKKYLDS